MLCRPSLTICNRRCRPSATTTPSTGTRRSEAPPWSRRCSCAPSTIKIVSGRVRSRPETERAGAWLLIGCRPDSFRFRRGLHYRFRKALIPKMAPYRLCVPSSAVDSHTDDCGVLPCSRPAHPGRSFFPAIFDVAATQSERAC